MFAPLPFLVQMLHLCREIPFQSTEAPTAFAVLLFPFPEETDPLYVSKVEVQECTT